MSIEFRLLPLQPERFESLLELGDDELQRHMARWVIADATPGYPCRVSLVDAAVGERLLLVPFMHHDVDSPYRASGPILIREAAQAPELNVNEIPTMFHTRSLSVRAYDAAAMMVTARTTEGTDLRRVIEEVLEDDRVDYLHLHNAGPGCFNCSVHRLRT